MQLVQETHNTDGTGNKEHDVYYVGGCGWDKITDVPCPVEGCEQTVLWYEAGYVPGYRVCMGLVEFDGPHPRGKELTLEDGELYDPDTLKHRFLGEPGPEAKLILLEN